MTGNPASAAVVKPFAMNYNKAVYGDFLYAGNGALRCPVPADFAPATGVGNTPAACAGGANRDNTTVNDNYFMQWSDVDFDPGTFDSSRASVTIPPGAKVEFARLNWAGNTGVYNTYPGVVSPTKMCQDRNFQTPAIPPPGSPDRQPVRLTVGGGNSTDISPASYTADPSNTFSGGQYYSAYADVTSQFATAPTGSPLELTVGNVWAPKGFGCMGGWSIALVYSYPERNPDYAPSKREVFVYDGHVRQNSTDPTTNVTISGFRAAAADAHVGVTAYEGDWGIPRDTFLINDQPTFEPATGDASNFFISNADGASNPAVKNNYSVDAKSFNTSAIPAGATSAKLGFSTGGDAYLAQNLAFSVPLPELQITKTASPEVVHAGDQVTFTIVVRNPSGAAASGVEVTDDAFPACSKKIGGLAGGATTRYTCTATAPGDDFSNTAKVTGRSALDDPLDGTSTVQVDVIHPAIGITKKADKPAYRAGDTVTFTVTVTNTGDVPLTSVNVADPKAASCARTLPGTLAPGASQTFTCTAKAPIADGVNTATVTGTDPLGKVVNASADAPAPTIAPAIEVTKSANPAVIHAGEQVTWTITVRNTGDSPLDPVKLTDDTTTSCSRAFGALAPGASQTYTCTANPSKTTKNTVTATGTDRSGQPVTATASATVTVINPALTIQKDASPAVVRTGDQITFTITVTNAGDVPLSDVAVADDHTPSCVRTFGTLAPGASQKYTCTAPAPADDFTNTATATGKDQTGRELKVTADAKVDVIHPAVAITKSASPAQAREGDTVTFTIVVTNTGDVPLAGVTVADDKVAGCAKTLGTLTPQGKQTYSCTVVAGAQGFTNTAKVTGTDPTNRPVDATADATFTVLHPGLSIAKDVKGGPFRAGDAVTFTITVTNTGDAPLTAVKVTDDLAPACAKTFDRLEPGAKQSYECTMTAPADDVVNVANVTGTPPVGPPVTSTDDAKVDVIHPGIAITKDAAPKVVRQGDTVTFTITVTNTGDSQLREVSVADRIAPHCGKSLGTLEPQAKQTYTCTMVAGKDDFTNTATATGTDVTNRPVTATADAAVDVIHPAVAITKTASPAQVREGDTVTFTIVVTNTGDVPLTGVTVADDKVAGCAKTLGTLAPQGKQTYTCTVVAGPQGFTNTAKVTGTDPTNRPVDATADATFTVQRPAVTIVKEVKGGPFREGDTVSFQITVRNTGDVPLTGVKVADPLVADCARAFDGALAPGATWGFGCTGKAPADDFTNVATVTGTPPVGPPVTATGEAKVDVIHPGIAITKDATPKVVRAGDTVTFTITVTNTGDSALRDVFVADLIAPDCAKRFGTLESQAKQTYTCTLVAGENDFTNTATANGTDGTNRPVTATADAAVDVIHPAITITKSAAPAQVREGDTVMFTIVVKNTGDVPLTAVSVVDDRTPSCAHNVASLAAGAEEKYTCSLVAGADGFTNTAKVTGTDPTKRPVTATGDATFTVLHPGLSIAKDVKGGPFREGDTVTFTIVVTNTGDSPLTAVKVTDDLAPACAKAFDRLEPGAKQTYECTMTAPADDVVNVAKVTGTPPTGPPITATDDAKVDVIHPAVTITKDASPKVVRAGDTVTFTIVVKNTGDAPLTKVSVVDDQAPSCARTFDSLDVGVVQTYQCSMIAPEDDFSNVVKVTGTPPVGPPVTATGTATVDVVYPAIAIMKDAAPYQVREGDTVTFTILVKNIGNAPLTDVSVVDDKTPSCARNFPSLAPDAEQKFTCTAIAGAQGFTNVAKATGTDPTKRTVTASDDASFVVQHPGVTITKTAKDGPFRTGDSVPFEIVVTNSGDVELHNVRVADSVAPECARTFDSLPVNGIQRYACTMTAPADDVTNVAKVTGTPPVGSPVSKESSARVDVIHPAVKITKDVEPRQVRPGEQVTFSLSVTNTGDVPLTKVSVVDDKTPSCAFTVDTLAVGATETRTCSISARQDVTNVATVTGDDPTGRPVTDSAKTSVDVIGPGLTVTKTGPAKPVLPGQKVTFTVVVKNTGDVTLTDVTLDDKVAPGCSKNVGTLKPDESAAPVTCEVTMGENDITNTVRATGKDPTGKPVDSTADAVAKVAKPGIDLVKKGDASVRAGGTATFKLTVTNTGNVDLVALELTDPAFPACDRSFARLAVGEHQEWTCTATAPQSGELTNFATVTGKPDTEQPGDPVKDTDSVTIKVITPPPTTNPTVPPGPGTPVTPPGPNPPPLPNTGYDPWPTAFTGMGLLAGGVLLLLLRPLRNRRGRS
ncbi:hypothetical protein [Amycolatopsis sp. NPDC059021]|uniref:DUF7507 domain-containing protein n=1 Tax=Amycolatopsis sp. NPDC059021 TaxID=3346704 RepID=UPI003672C783